MKEKYIWAGVSFALGAAVSGLATWAVLRRKYEKELAAAVMAECEECQKKKNEDYKNVKSEWECGDVPVAPPELQHVSQPNILEDGEDAVEKLNAAIRAMVDYSGVPLADREQYTRQVLREEGCPLDDEDVDRIFSETEHPEDDDPEPQDEPYIITEEEFCNSNVGPGWDSEIVSCFDEESTFIDSTDELITDVRDIAGGEVLTWFKEHPHAPVCYVRNDKLRIDYEILRCEGSALEAVMGEHYEPEPEEGEENLAEKFGVDDDGPSREKIKKRKQEE